MTKIVNIKIERDQNLKKIFRRIKNVMYIFKRTKNIYRLDFVNKIRILIHLLMYMPKSA